MNGSTRHSLSLSVYRRVKFVAAANHHHHPSSSSSSSAAAAAVKAPGTHADRQLSLLSAAAGAAIRAAAAAAAAHGPEGEETCSICCNKTRHG